MTERVEWCTVVWQIVDGASAASPTLSTFGVAALTGAIGVLGILIGQKNQARSQAKSVRAALLAEVSAIYEQLKTQNFESGLRARAEVLREGKEQIQRFAVSSNGDVNRIYKANLAHLGGLSKKEAMLIVRFHYLLEGALAAVVKGGPLAEGRREPEVFDTVASGFAEVLELGEELTCASRTRRWLRFGGQNVDT